VVTVKPTTVRDLLTVAKGWLGEQGVEEAQLDTQLLLAHTLGCRRLDLFLDHDRPLMESELARFRTLMRRRGAREPVAYILGERGFHSLVLKVAPGVLIPRPETELLVEVGLEELGRIAVERSGGTELRCADVGTGSGCVALALATEWPGLSAVALDVSPQALKIAAANAQALELSGQVRFVHGDLLSAVAPGSLDLVVSNPPYITPDEEHLLAPEVANFEPKQALFDAPGLPLTQALVKQAKAALRPGGALAIETGYKSAEQVAAFMEAAGFTDVRRVKDLAEIDRVIVGRLPSA
jgi:release factor glutamine methyltransferase